MTREIDTGETVETRAILEGLSFVRLVFVDMFGSIRSCQVPAARLLHDAHPKLNFDGSAIEGRTRLLEEDMLLVPDFSTLTNRGRTHTGHATGMVFCTVETPDGEAWLVDPRTALISTCQELSDLANRWTASAELEFYILQPDLHPADRGGYYSDLEGVGTAVCRAVAGILHTLNLPISGMHHEAGPGQYEIDLPALDPVTLADAIILTKQMIAEEAAVNDLKVTFAARPLTNEPGSGLHLHQHIEDAPVVPFLSPEAEAIMAGILEHARGLTALAAPTANSYKRLHAGPEAPGMVIWAHANRSALLRVGTSTEGVPSIEFRAADPSCNPYLLVAGLLTVEAAGLSNGGHPGRPVEEESTGFDPTAAKVAPKPLPRNLDEALDALMDDEVLCDTFDSRLLNRLIEGSRGEIDAANQQVSIDELDIYTQEGIQ